MGFSSLRSFISLQTVLILGLIVIVFSHLSHWHRVSAGR
jgi:hypothetical protein